MIPVDKMITKKLIAYFLILLLSVYPASAAEISLDRWVLNITLGENGIVEEVIQAEIQNSDPSPLEGISFFIPSSKVTMIYDFAHTFSSYGEEVQQQTVPGGTIIKLIFNQSVKSGVTWSGRIGFTAENMVIKDSSNFSLTMPIDMPQAIVSGENVKMTVAPDADIRAQVFLPKSYEIISVQPEPFRNLFQYGKMVPTWTPDKLHMGDTIRITASYSDVLAKIVDNDDRVRMLEASIREASEKGRNVPEAKNHLAKANENNNKAFASFGGKDYSVALEYAGYANEELTRAENSLSGGVVKETPKATEKTPGFEAYVLGTILIITFLINKKRNT